MRKAPRSLTALALAALIGAGCSEAPSDGGNAGAGTAGDQTAGHRDKAMRFAACMRENGVAAFPDPDASGGLTIDGIANGTSLDPSTPAFDDAMTACKDLVPAGFTGRKRSRSEQESALAFAQCMRENGIEDFPDPVEGGPLIDTNRIPSAAGRGARDIPGFKAAQDRCSAMFAGELGLPGQ